MKLSFLFTCLLLIYGCDKPQVTTLDRPLQKQKLKEVDVKKSLDGHVQYSMPDFLLKCGFLSKATVDETDKIYVEAYGKLGYTYFIFKHPEEADFLLSLGVASADQNLVNPYAGKVLFAEFSSPGEHFHISWNQQLQKYTNE